MSRGYYEYFPAAEKREEARKKLEKLRKKDPSIQPVTVDGNKIARTFWGISWNKNLESYADYENRIGRGKSYVKNGMVLDLRIEEGFAKGLVMGSRSAPYSVEIFIDKISQARWDAIRAVCSRKLDGIEGLIKGDFPKEYAELFLRQGEGLFPSPKEIRMKCSCPDWADMCKHVAALLYGIGTRLDNDPLLFFKLRRIDFGEFVKKSIEDKMESLLKNADKKTARVLDGIDLEDVFGLRVH